MGSSRRPTSHHLDVSQGLQQKERDGGAAAEMASKVMQSADIFSSNGSLTAVELGTLATGAQRGFAEWLMESRMRRFKRYDSDKDGALQWTELEAACEGYLRAQAVAQSTSKDVGA